MFMAGIQALANLAPALHDPNASLLPDLSDVREVSVHVAAAIVRQACKEGRTRDETVLKVVNGELGEGLEEFIRGSMWDPVSIAREIEWCREASADHTNKPAGLPSFGVDRLDVFGRGLAVVYSRIFHRISVSLSSAPCTITQATNSL
jgi:hypothetical protein